MPGRTRVIDPLTRDYVSDGRGSYETTLTIQTAVYHQITARRGEWVGDADAGSDIHLIRQGGDSPINMDRAADAVRDALQPFLDAGTGANVQVDVTRDTRGRFAVESSIEDVQYGEVNVTPMLPFGP